MIMKGVLRFDYEVMCSGICYPDIAHKWKTCAVINNSPLLAAVDFHNQDMDRNSMPCPPDRRGSPTTTSIARSAARVTRPTKGTVNPFGPLFLGNTARAARFTPNFPSSTPNALVYSWSLTTRKIPTKSQRFFCTCTSSEEEFICQKKLTKD